MHRLKNYIFLTRKEVSVLGPFTLTASLTYADTRSSALLRLCSRPDHINLVVYDPMTTGEARLLPGRWYLLPRVRYHGRSMGKQRVTFSFGYGYTVLGSGVREMTDREVEYFRANNELTN